jgi:hypothetical protein
MVSILGPAYEPVPEEHRSAHGGGFPVPTQARSQSRQVRNSARPVVVNAFLFHFAGLGCDWPVAGSKLALRNACPGLELWGSPASRDVRSGSPCLLTESGFHGCERALENREI